MISEKRKFLCPMPALVMWITASLSRLVGQCRIWNHRRQECVLKRQLTDDPVDLSLHCSGLMLLIAYSDRLQLLYILRYAYHLHKNSVSNSVSAITSLSVTVLVPSSI